MNEQIIYSLSNFHDFNLQKKKNDNKTDISILLQPDSIDPQYFPFPHVFLFPLLPFFRLSSLFPSILLSIFVQTAILNYNSHPEDDLKYILPEIFVISYLT